MNASFDIYLLMRRSGWRYRPFSFKEVGKSRCNRTGFLPVISYNKNLKHIKTGNYNIKYVTKLSSTKNE
jgi:hypothetical protein